MHRLLAGITLLAVAATPAVACRTPVAAPPPGLVVSVAASMHDALAEIAGLYRAAAGVIIAPNTGSSSTLARQIVEGAPVAVFLSADQAQMDIVEKAGRLAPGTRTPLVTNQLAVIAPAPSALTLPALLEGRVSRLAMGETASVPAGVYGRRWLEHEGAWMRVQATVIPFPTVRAVLSAVEAGRVDAGIVYATDARDRPVHVVATLAGKDYDYLGIVQPAAVIAGSAEAEGRRFLQFLQGAEARAVFTRRGFGAPSASSGGER
ncbi:MAG: molybdate ABC transporter substrate-binding protein [Vicinamibacterales bacterium]